MRRKRSYLYAAIAVLAFAAVPLLTWVGREITACRAAQKWHKDLDAADKLATTDWAGASMIADNVLIDMVLWEHRKQVNLRTTRKTRIMQRVERVHDVADSYMELQYAQKEQMESEFKEFEKKVLKLMQKQRESPASITEKDFEGLPPDPDMPPYPYVKVK